MISRHSPGAFLIWIYEHRKGTSREVPFCHAKNERDGHVERNEESLASVL